MKPSHGNSWMTRSLIIVCQLVQLLTGSQLLYQRESGMVAEPDRWRVGHLDHDRALPEHGRLCRLLRCDRDADWYLHGLTHPPDPPSRGPAGSAAASRVGG